MSSSWFSLTADVPEANSEALEALLYEYGATGLELREPSTTAAPLTPMPGVRQPAAGEVVIVAWFETKDAAEAAQTQLSEALPSARLAIDELPAQDWSSSWKALIRSVEVGTLWVGPPWDAEKATPNRTRIIIEPKMAFGTGDHPTTSLCLEAVDDFMGAHPGASVLDVGTGTGVLAIAAKRLGAGRVVGVDNDPISVELAHENAVVNATPDVAFSGKTLDQLEGRFDLVLANILANTLVELAPLISAATGRRLVLAGVLVPQRDEVAAAYLAQGLRSAGQKIIGEWIRLDFERP